MIADQLEMTGTPGEGRGEGGEGRRGEHITYIHSDTYIHAKMMHNIILTVCMCAITHNIHLLLNVYRF